MEVLHIATAGSVDDGKSTLIGRLLYDTRSVTQDKLDAIEQVSKRKGLGYLDLSLLTDGLIAEREQGITIDVAHIFFATARRKYIIADTPGHFEYTRNMVTGASNAEVSLILIDARNGVVEQTYRHFYIASLLKIPHVVVCINKMDLVQYDKDRFLDIVREFSTLAEQAGFSGQQIRYIPVSSLYGENVVNTSREMGWYDGPSLLDYLETLKTAEVKSGLPARFAVQYVIRPKTEQYHDYRWYAGKLASGTLKVGDELLVLPGMRSTRLMGIEKNGISQSSALARESVVLHISDDLDISRGNMLVPAGEVPAIRQQFQARICWMDHQKLRAGSMYLLQHGHQLVKTKVLSLVSRVDVQTLTSADQPDHIGLNDIATVTLKTSKALFADAYAVNPANGAFILIDEHSNNTVAVGFVQE